MKLDVVKQFSIRSERVKGIDLHPTEPWVLTTLYNGKVEIWSYATNSLVKSIQVTDLPIRTGKFIARKNWIVVGGDDFQLRVYNYNTGEKVVQFEAHPDYVRYIAVHPSKPYVLTCSDDLTIRLWNWENNWKLEQVFEGHQHYIMSVNFNPKDPNTFASACLDRTVKIWSLGSPTANFTLVAHGSKGVNYADYYPQSDKPYLITCSDDKTIKIWDYQTKSCIATLEGHLSNVSFASFHPELPVIISGSEDGTIKFWNSNTFKLEKSINYSLERLWCMSVLSNSNLLAVGGDSGYVIAKLGNEEPLYSMDSNNKLIYAKTSEVYQSILKPTITEGLKDGDSLSLQQRELGTIEIYPQSLAHSPNGRYVAVVGDGEYIIYTALAWRSKTYGKALELAWNSHDFTNNSTFAIREGPLSVKIFKNFQEEFSLSLIYQADKIFPGYLLGVKSDGCITFYDWESGKLARRVDIDDDILDVVWSDNGELLSIITAPSSSGAAANSDSNTGSTKTSYETYFLTYNHEIFQEALDNDQLDPEEGAESSFDVLSTLPSSEAILSGKFIGDVFIYTTSSTFRLNYYVGGEVINLGHFDHKYYIIGYKSGSEGKLYMIDKSFNVISWFVNSDVLELQTLVMRGDLEQFATEEIEDESGEPIPDVSNITEDQLSEEYSNLMKDFNKTEMNQLSRFFEKLGYLSLSYSLSQDFDSKFQICLTKNDLSQAYKLLLESQNENLSSALGNASKWKKLGDLALNQWKIKLALDCFWLAKDHASLLLLLSSTNNVKELTKLAEECETTGKYNIAFQAWWIIGEKEKCSKLLQKGEKFTEAAFLSKNYSLSSEIVSESVDAWKSKLSSINKSKVSNRLIADFESQAPADSLIDLKEPKQVITEAETKVEA
ncbi:Coatomer subunit beta' [Yamadazyma tenuis]|uniref:Coatomer subunit beta' n=1 Tax=Candida tenuis (strain ATCC 10573 / BCRC 21748 / CBS 615 / JCM 9827 / NBRC 10315 / NRRL Y-1498 / VKM Y-70) TaxID=590646 RepID=G3B209_CANTC|nr:Coatomer, beta' subunit [Yamadazyma tenuis ATCC 10573]EGV64577.1 Coatomer, beta' subunit [Yamadazyma tenuis ATCC 10573]WEJ97344.1 Coatomer subunit beta' [Yamadazyma tenuis]